MLMILLYLFAIFRINVERRLAAINQIDLHVDEHVMPCAVLRVSRMAVLSENRLSHLRAEKCPEIDLHMHRIWQKAWWHKDSGSFRNI